MAAKVSASYPRAGDRGQTSLPGGARVSKASLAVAAGGEVDELVSQVGLLRAQVRAALAAAGEPAGVLRAIQADLYAVAAILAGPAAASVRRAAQFGRRRRVRFLDAQLRRCAGELPPALPKADRRRQ